MQPSIAIYWCCLASVFFKGVASLPSWSHRNLNFYVQMETRVGKLFCVLLILSNQATTRIYWPRNKVVCCVCVGAVDSGTAYGQAQDDWLDYSIISF